MIKFPRETIANDQKINTKTKSGRMYVGERMSDKEAVSFVFSPLRAELTIQQNEREAMIRDCRDLTSYSKKLIFACHRSNSSNNPEELYELFQKLSTTLNRIYQASLVLNDFMSYKKSISNALEEYIEFVTFSWYLGAKSLISYRELIGVTKILIVGSSSNELLRPIITLLMGIDDGVHTLAELEKQFNTSDINLNFVFMGDYVMGLFDLTGELMRYAIVHADDQETKAVSDVTISIYTFLRNLKLSLNEVFSRTTGIDIRAGIMEGNASTSNQILKKLETMNASVSKVEAIIIGTLIRGEESACI